MALKERLKHQAKHRIKQALLRRGYSIHRVYGGFYNEDGLYSIHNSEFTRDPEFLAAYTRALASGGGIDMHHRWRVHTVLWAADVASRLPGDFVECGVNTGFMSTAAMFAVDWNRLGKRFFLLDTFDGPVHEYFSDFERELGWPKRSRKAHELGQYQGDVGATRRNFSEWERVEIIQGPVPVTLDQVDSDEIAYLHLDMNQAYPEVAAAEFFWDKMADGGLMLLDDYGFHGHEAQKRGLDEFASKREVRILCMPTGQGLIQRPPRS